MKKIIIYSFILLLCFISNTKVYAMTGRLDKIDYIYNTYNTNGSSSYTRNSSYKLYVDDILTYCVTPGVLFRSGEGYYEGEYSGLSPNDVYKMELISYYGYHEGYHNSFEYYLATQELIHNVLGYNTTYNYGDFDVLGYKAEIDYLIGRHNVVPTIDDDIYVLPNKSYTFVDTNAVLTNFRIDASSNVSYSINSNVLDIYLNDENDGYIKFYKGDDDQTKFYLKDDSQVVASFSLPKQVMKTINIHKIDSGRVEVIDYDRATNTKRSGITYNLIDSNNNILETKTTDDNGYLIYDNYYEYGNYSVNEVGGDSYSETFNLDSSLKTLKFYHGKTGSITINNISIDGKKLDGIFDVFKDDNYVYNLSDLVLGNYKIIQREAQAGYIKDDNTYSVDITRDNLDQSITIINQMLLGSITVNNYDNLGNKLTGVFEIKNEDGVICDTSNLIPGKYYVSQVSSQKGYYLDNNIYEVNITIDDLDKELTIINDKILGNIDVFIVDESGNSLSGNYMIYDKNNNIYDGINLIPGTYYVKQTECMEGYYIDEKAHRVIIKENDLHKELKIVNKLITGSISVSIVDEEGNEISGTYDIYDDNDNKYNGKKLVPGLYHVKQKTVKKGYYKDDKVYDIDITLNDLNKELTIVNKLITGSISVSIVDEEGNEISGTYEISKDEKLCQSDNLVPGIYQVKQLTSSYGYTLDDNIYDIQVSLDDLDKKLVIVNRKLLGNISVKIVNEYGEVIDGKYIIYDKYDNQYNGVNLELGTYYVKQLSSISGYSVDDSIYEVKINVDNLDEEVVITNKYNLEIIPKTSDNNYIFIYPIILLIGFLALRLRKQY